MSEGKVFWLGRGGPYLHLIIFDFSCISYRYLFRELLLKLGISL